MTTVYLYTIILYIIVNRKKIKKIDYIIIRKPPHFGILVRRLWISTIPAGDRETKTIIYLYFID